MAVSLRSWWISVTDAFKADLGVNLLAVGIGLIGGSMIQERASWFTIALLGVGTAVYVMAALWLPRAWTPRVAVVAASVASALVFGSSVSRFSQSLLNVPEILTTQVLAAALVTAALLTGANRRGTVRALAVIVLALTTFYGLRFAVQDPIAIDVYLLHEAAAEALNDGKNPYTSGNVEVLESLRFEDKEVIREYTYPPLTLVAYASSSILLGDSRIVGAIAIVGAFWLTFVLVGRREASESSVSNLDAALVGLLCINPMTYLMVFSGWTEAIALPLMVLAAAFWTRRPVLSAVALGLAFATKQYFIVAVPVLFLLPDPQRWKRLIVTTATAAATFVPFLVWDARGLWAGVVEHHLTRAPRPDAATLAGIGIIVPTTVAVLTATGIALLLSRRVRSGGHLLAAVATVISVFTFLSVRGFRNTWWLAVVLASVALGFGGHMAGAIQRDPPEGTTAQT